LDDGHLVCVEGGKQREDAKGGRDPVLSEPTDSL